MSAASGGRQWHDREGPQGRASLPQSPRVAGAGLCPGQYRGIRGQAGPRPAPDGTGARAAAPGRALGPVRHEIFCSERDVAFVLVTLHRLAQPESGSSVSPDRGWMVNW